ncbi:adenylate kinase 8-like [Pocillopora damicornis]|uniref:adenylate kinase 8-like n=1 Tax=Pocillopora damicornis TaxID=46731 RepID=UPI000F55155A|nr:adenylate kinase 8-like [Pocillopora damicornis]
MDATKKPLLIPPEFSNYAEKHGIFQIYESLLTKLIIEQPADPLTYMIGLLEQESEVPQIIIHGPPAAGKRTMSVMAAKHFDCVHITLDNLLAESDSKSAKKAQEYISAKEMVPTHIWVSLIKERLQKEDCINVYHSTFDPPSDLAVVQRLVPDSKSSEKVMIQRLMEYHRHIDGILMCFEKIHKSINVDQPKADVFSQVLSYLKMNHRNNAPHTPRLILLGPTGCGKSVQAELLASKYGFVNVSCTELIKQSLVDDSKLGEAVRPYIDRHMLVPDDLVLQLLKSRLAQLDAVTKGWVIHGFPKTREQAESLARAGYEANRVIFMDVPTDTILERLTLRSVDPVTGERYHLIYNPPRTNEVKQRLHTSPKDVESAVNSRIAQYQAYIEEIAEYYEESAQHINADQDIHTVFECIESIIVNPIPTKNEV